MKIRKQHAFFVGAIGYISVVFFLLLPILFLPKGQLVFGEDIHSAYYFFRSLYKHSIQQGSIPWWNPYTFNGSPFMANPIVNPFYLWTLIYIILPLNSAFSWHMAIHIVLAMMSMYWMVYTLIGEKTLTYRAACSSWLAGLVFGLSGYVVSRIYAGHVDIIASFSYTPLVFGLFYRLIQVSLDITKTLRYTLRAVVFAAIACSIQLYAGYQTMALFTLEAVMILAVLTMMIKKSIRFVAFLVGAIVLGFGLSALQLVPMQEVVSHGIRTHVFPYEWVSFGSSTFASFSHFINPFAWGDYGNYRGVPPNYWEHAGYIGKLPFITVVLSIGVLCVRSFRKKHDQPFAYFYLLFGGVVLFGLWMSMGNNAGIDLLHMFYRVIPIYQRLRFPSRHLALVVFGGASLFGLSIYILGSIIKTRWFYVVVACFVLLDLGFYTRHFLMIKESPEYRQDSEFLSFVTNSEKRGRVFPNFGAWIPPAKTMDFDSPLLYMYESGNGYDPTILADYYSFIDVANENTQSSIDSFDVQAPYFYTDNPYMDYLNFLYVVSAYGYDVYGGISTPTYTKVLDNPEAGYIVYENLNVMPRYFFVPHVIQYDTDQEAAAYIQNDGYPFSVRTHVLLKKDQKTIQTPSKDVCPDTFTSDVEIETYTPNYIQLKTSSSCSGYVVGSDTYFPGWHAWVDGERLPLLKANTAFRAVAVPSGEHIVEMRYVPTIFVIGGLVSLVTGGICVWMIRRGNKNKI